jgi:hypothetical protein
MDRTMFPAMCQPAAVIMAFSAALCAIMIVGHGDAVLFHANHHGG